MTTTLKSTAQRLTFSLLLLSTLGGCAVYGPAAGPYAYYGTDANGQAVYAAPPVATFPYYYGPAYVGPPMFLNFGFGGYWGGGRGGYRGGGGRGGGHGGGHR